MKRKEYEAAMEPLREELVAMARWARSSGERIVVLFEGRDTAGKGGAIRAVSDKLNPRQCHIVALAKPTEAEQSQWYFQRYAKHLPSAGEIVLFDRSWYNRAGVEPVMGFCTQDEHQEFLHEVPQFEKMLVNAGIIVIKFYFSVSKKEQAKRFKERERNPLKHYKLSPIDLRSQELWDKYTIAEYSMFMASHTEHAPWTVIHADKKKKARLNCIKYILKQIDYHDRVEKKLLKTDGETLYSADRMIAAFDSSVALQPEKADKGD